LIASNRLILIDAWPDLESISPSKKLKKLEIYGLLGLTRGRDKD